MMLNKKALGILLCGISGAALLSGAAHAQTTVPTTAANPQSEEISDIIVTAQKRDERLRDVPISVTAATADQLSKQGIDRPADLTRLVPGFTYQESSYSVPVFTVRGIGLYDTSVGIAPTVSVYVDQVPLPYLAMTEGAALDLERVEVLKGPQGTLFGQNSTGGAINYIAAKPTADPHMGASLTYGRFNQVDMQAYVSGPITSTLRARVAVRNEYRDAWQHSETRPSDSLGRRDFSVGRVLLEWTPTSRFTLELNANGWRDRSETRAAQFVQLKLNRPGGYPDSTIALGTRPPAPNDAQVADWDASVDLRRNDYLYQFSGRADYDLSDALKLTAITAYSRYQGRTPTDPDGTDYRDILVRIDADVTSFTQELRLAADLNMVKLTVGGNFQSDTSDETRTILSNSSNQGAGPFRFGGFRNISDQRVKTYAGFASVDVKLTPELTLQGSARYTKQDRDFEGCLADAGNGGLAKALSLITGVVRPNGACVTIDQATGKQVDILTDKLDQNNLSWRASISYRPNRNINLYANVTKGYKAGAFSPVPAIYSGQLKPVTQESVLAYEVGLKAGLLDHLVDFTSAVFYYKYDNKQILGFGVFPPFGNLPQLQNIPKSDVLGAEAQVSLNPMRGLKLTAGITYVRSRVDSSYVTTDPNGTLINVKGEAFPNTPRWQAIATAEYGFAVGSDYRAFFSGNVSYRSESNAAFGGNPVFRFKPYSLVGLRAGFGSADERWRLELWGENITNTFYWINVSKNVDATARLPGMPATYGVTLRTKF